MTATMPPSNSNSRWFLRLADQALVAASVMLALVGTVGWWAVNGGEQLIEFDHAEPLTARFEVDINEADWPELMQLPGIGETLARRIVESRRTGGLFADNDDLQRVPGIGAKKLERLRPYLRPKPGGRAAVPP